MTGVKVKQPHMNKSYRNPLESKIQPSLSQELLTSCILCLQEFFGLFGLINCSQILTTVELELLQDTSSCGTLIY